MILGIKGWTNEADNKSTISIAHNPFQHDHTKHIENDRHFLKEKLERIDNYSLSSQATNQLMS